MMNTYLSIRQSNWQTRILSYGRLLLRWGWFVLFAVILTTFCSSLLPDILSPDSYQATLELYVQIPSNGQGELNTSTSFISQALVSPDTLSLVLSEHSSLGLQLSDLQGVVSATALTNTNVVLLSASGATPHDASVLATDVYQAFINEIHKNRALIVTKLYQLLTNDLNQVESEIANSTAQLQSLSATHQQGTSQYRQVNVIYQDEQNRALTINSTLTSLTQEGNGSNDIFKLSSISPDITTIPGATPTQSQRLALSPLVGLIMGLGGALLASRFSSTLPLQSKKRELVLPDIATIIPIIPHLRKRPLEVLQQTSSLGLPLLLRLRYQAQEHERRLQVITITSPRGREGKSTIATSLALAAAQSGLRTLLVDAHPRRPVLHTWFQRPNDTGMLNILQSLAAGKTYPSPIINTSIMHPGLIPLGKTTPTVKAKSLESALRVDELRSFTDLLCNQADLIIFDGPSLLGNTDTVNLAMLSDVVLLVVDTHKSQSAKVIEAESLLSQIGATHNIALNRAKPESVE